MDVEHRFRFARATLRFPFIALLALGAAGITACSGEGGSTAHGADDAGGDATLDANPTDGAAGDADATNGGNDGGIDATDGGGTDANGASDANAASDAEAASDADGAGDANAASDAGGAGDANGASDAGATSDADGASDSGGGPIILNLSTNVTTMTSNEQLIVTAVVTDAAGINQVIGGTLADPGAGTYGAFQVSTTSGAWSLTLTWTAIGQVKPIDSGVGGQSRVFRATFYDQAGRTTSRDLTVQLSCGANDTTDSFCGGQCFDLETDKDHCGTCGNACAIGTSCTQGACVCPVAGQVVCPPGYCYDLQKDPHNCGTCGNACSYPASCQSGHCGFIVKGTASASIPNCGVLCDANNGWCDPSAFAPFSGAIGTADPPSGTGGGSTTLSSCSQQPPTGWLMTCGCVP
jgi:hypothetical protein